MGEALPHAPAVTIACLGDYMIWTQSVSDSLKTSLLGPFPTVLRKVTNTGESCGWAGADARHFILITKGWLIRSEVAQQDDTGLLAARTGFLKFFWQGSFPGLRDSIVVITITIVSRMFYFCDSWKCRVSWVPTATLSGYLLAMFAYFILLLIILFLW